jgi:hypothetical protein
MCYDKESREKLRYDRIAALLKTGDVILFSGEGALSWIVKLATLSEWSHIGMVIKCKEITEGIKDPDLKDPNDLYLWHSTFPVEEKVIDVLTGEPKEGVQLSPLKQYLEAYKGLVVVRRISITNIKCSDIGYWILSESKKQYERNFEELISASCRFGYKGNIDYYFCSELYIETLVQWGVIERKRPSNQYTPDDFSEKRMRKLGKNVVLGKEIIIVR